MRTVKRLVVCFALSWIFVLSAAAQNISGMISGTVVDPQGALVVDANVTAVEQNRQFTLTTKTNSSGRFVFPEAPAPGDYTITIVQSGFKTYKRQNISLSPSQQVALGDLSLAIGDMAQSVEVQATAVMLNVETAERSQSLTSGQLQNTAVYGRNPIDLVKILPGIVSNADFSSPGTGGIGGFSANGAGNIQNNLTFNGLTNLDAGGNASQNVTVSLDSVAQVVVLTGSYSAEFGRNAGMQINVVTKSGTSQLHGSGYWIYRHESLNANTWANNRQGIRRTLYRQQDPGYTVGGPVYIPRLYPHRDKLFFFWSQEFQRQMLPASATKAVVPTALERQGDFSQSYNNTSGAKLTKIIDPTTNAPFGGLQIPLTRLYDPTLTILKYLPLPTNPGVTGGNYITQISSKAPRREDMLQVDYNASAKLRFFGNYINNADNRTLAYSGYHVSQNIPLAPISYQAPGRQLQIGNTVILSPVMMNQVTFGISHSQADLTFTEPVWSYPAVGLSTPLPTLFPVPDGANGLIPVFDLAGTSGMNSPSPMNLTGAMPYHADNTLYSVNDTFSKVFSSHTAKAGTYVEFIHKNEQFPMARAVAGTGYGNTGWYNFGENPSNPLDTGYGMANMALGVFNWFSQTNIKRFRESRAMNIEFFVQDSWKVSRRVTVNYGLRGGWYQPSYTPTLDSYNFQADRYDPAAAPRYYYPAYDSSHRVVAVDPVTGATAPDTSFVGTIVPTSGALANGMVKAGSTGVSKYFVENRGIQWGPRLGIAWDIFGDQKTILRTGGGISYDRSMVSAQTQVYTNYPLFQNPMVYNGYVSEVASATQKIGTQTIAANAPDGHIPTTYSYNFGLQRALPLNIALDVSYVGSMSRHQSTTFNINSVPYGAAYLPENQNPTVTSSRPGGAALAADFMRVYKGYAGITSTIMALSSNYNSLQISVARKLSTGLLVDVNYTWSKNLGVSGLRSDQYARLANYGLNGYDRRHSAAVNYIYSFPSVFRTNRVLHGIVDGWQISGITRFSSGSPGSVGYSISGWNSTNLTGTPDAGGRIVVAGNSVYGNGGLDYLNYASFAPPQPGSRGLESGRVTFINPGWSNWDMAMLKTFAVREKLSFEVRFDAFNAFNHTEYNSVYSTATFSSPDNRTPTNINALNANGTVNTLKFGAFNNTQTPRRCQLSVHVRF